MRPVVVFFSLDSFVIFVAMLASPDWSPHRFTKDKILEELEKTVPGKKAWCPFR